MNSQQAPGWLPSFLVPFVTLSYPATTPAEPDSFPNSAFYGTGPLDVCLVISCIAVMAVLRDAARLTLMEPFAEWKLTRDLVYSKKIQANGKAPAATNGNANGHGAHASEHSTYSQKETRKLHRKVLRFAEQGWSVIYYIITWSYGLVRIFLICHRINISDKKCSISILISLRRYSPLQRFGYIIPKYPSLGQSNYIISTRLLSISTRC